MFSSNLLPVRLFGRVMRWRLVYGRRGLAAGLHVGGVWVCVRGGWGGFAGA